VAKRDSIIKVLVKMRKKATAEHEEARQARRTARQDAAAEGVTFTGEDVEVCVLAANPHKPVNCESVSTTSKLLDCTYHKALASSTCVANLQEIHSKHV
jgi:hypothetical protein